MKEEIKKALTNLFSNQAPKDIKNLNGSILARREKDLQYQITRGSDLETTIKGFNPNPKSNPAALVWAVDAKKYEIAKALLEKFGFDANPKSVAPGKLTFSLLESAVCQTASKKMIELILDHTKPQNVNVARNKTRENALHFAVTSYPYSENSEIVEVVQLLLARGVDPKAQDEDGNTPLHSAMLELGKSKPINNTTIELFKCFIGAGANPERTNNKGLSLNSFLEAREAKGEQEAVNTIKQWLNQSHSGLFSVFGF